MQLIKCLKQKIREETGSEVVEFALCIYLWMGAVFVLMYGSFAIYTAHFVANASDAAVRYASVRGSSWSGASCSSTSNLDCSATATDVADFVTNSLPPGLSPANLTVTTSWPGTTSSGGTCDTQDGVNSPNCVVEVEVQYNFSFPFLTVGTLPLTSTSEISISD